MDNPFCHSFLKDARTEVRVYDLQGKAIRNVDLPGIGTAIGFQGKRADKETFYSFTSFISPTTVYRYEPSSGKSSVFKAAQGRLRRLRSTRPSRCSTSKDGTRVPMFLTYKKTEAGWAKSDFTVCLWRVRHFADTVVFRSRIWFGWRWAGIYAQPNLRGGGEYGEEWHLAGTKAHKQNVFDDFIAAAEWLMANKYTSTPKLAIRAEAMAACWWGLASRNARICMVRLCLMWA